MELTAPARVTALPQWIRDMRTAGHGDAEIRKAAGRAWRFSAVQEAFAHADDPHAEQLAKEMEAIRAESDKAWKESRTRRQVAAGRLPAAALKSLTGGAWCRHCGGPASDGSGDCGCRTGRT